MKVTQPELDTLSRSPDDYDQHALGYRRYECPNCRTHHRSDDDGWFYYADDIGPHGIWLPCGSCGGEQAVARCWMCSDWLAEHLLPGVVHFDSPRDVLAHAPVLCAVLCRHCIENESSRG